MANLGATRRRSTPQPNLRIHNLRVPLRHRFHLLIISVQSIEVIILHHRIFCAPHEPNTRHVTNNVPGIPRRKGVCVCVCVHVHVALNPL